MRRHVHMKGEQMVARYMLGEVAEQGQAGSPGSDGASPYLSPRSPADTPIRRYVLPTPYIALAVEVANSFAFATVASTSPGAPKVGSTKIFTTSVTPINPRTPPSVLLCRS